MGDEKGTFHSLNRCNNNNQYLYSAFSKLIQSAQNVPQNAGMPCLNLQSICYVYHVFSQ